jgi:hypothetical protein
MVYAPSSLQIDVLKCGGSEPSSHRQRPTRSQSAHLACTTIHGVPKVPRARRIISAAQLARRHGGAGKPLASTYGAPIVTATEVVNLLPAKVGCVAVWGV